MQDGGFKQKTLFPKPLGILINTKENSEKSGIFFQSDLKTDLKTDANAESPKNFSIFKISTWSGLF